MTREFIVKIDTGNEEDDKQISETLINLLSLMPEGVTYKFRVLKREQKG